MFIIDEHVNIVYIIGGITVINKNIENNILDEALDAFRKNTGLKVEVEPKQYQIEKGIDAVVRIKWENFGKKFAVEIKNTITRETLGGIVQKLYFLREKGILVTRYVTPQLAEELKRMDIPFIDLAGNTYINEPPIMIYIKGNKLPEKYQQEAPTRAFRPAGMRVIYALLRNPGLEDAPFRDIAELTNVALGTVRWVMDDLNKLGYLLVINPRKRKLIRKKDLLNQWVTEYPIQLRNKLIMGRYRAEENEWWKYANLEEVNAFWGGEVAAQKLTDFLKPQIVTIYTPNPPGKLILLNRLKKDPNGDIEVLRAFWRINTDELHSNIVHPLLIYADLLATGDLRNLETARMIYEKELSKFVRED